MPDSVLKAGCTMTMGLFSRTQAHETLSVDESLFRV